MKVLNRDAIKYIVAFNMLLNHIGNVFLTPGTLGWSILVNIGYSTAVAMCYFLVEGYGYTRSKLRYGLRLFIFAALSEVPYCLAFTTRGTISFVNFNMLFTLLLCFLILVIDEKVQEPAAKWLLIFVAVVLSWWCDWPLMAPLFTVMFIYAKGDRRKEGLAFAVNMAIFAVFQLTNYPQMRADWRILNTLGGILGMALSAVMILFLYNGKRAEKGRGFSKWFFYVFYPVHLLILGILRLALR